MKDQPRPKATCGPKSCAESLGTTLWHHVQRYCDFPLLFKHFLTACVNVLALRYAPYQKRCLFYTKEVTFSEYSSDLALTQKPYLVFSRRTQIDHPFVHGESLAWRSRLGRIRKSRGNWLIFATGSTNSSITLSLVYNNNLFPTWELAQRSSDRYPFITFHHSHVWGLKSELGTVFSAGTFGSVFIKRCLYQKEIVIQEFIQEFGRGTVIITSRSKFQLSRIHLESRWEYQAQRLCRRPSALLLPHQSNSVRCTFTSTHYSRAASQCLRWRGTSLDNAARARRLDNGAHSYTGCTYTHAQYVDNLDLSLNVAKSDKVLGNQIKQVGGTMVSLKPFPDPLLVHHQYK